MAGRLGGIKPGSSVGGKEGRRERQRTLARRRQRSGGVRAGAWKHAGRAREAAAGRGSGRLRARVSPHAGPGSPAPPSLRRGQPGPLRRNALRGRELGPVAEASAARPPAMPESSRLVSLPGDGPGGTANSEGECGGRLSPSRLFYSLGVLNRLARTVPRAGAGHFRQGVRRGRGCRCAPGLG